MTPADGPLDFDSLLPYLTPSRTPEDEEAAIAALKEAWPDLQRQALAYGATVRAEERARIAKALRDARTGGLKTGHPRRPSGFSNAAAFVAALGEGV